MQSFLYSGKKKQQPCCATDHTHQLRHQSCKPREARHTKGSLSEQEEYWHDTGQCCESSSETAAANLLQIMF